MTAPILRRMNFWPLRAFRPSWRGKETGKLLPGPLVLAESVTEARELLQVGTFGRLGPPDQLVAEALIVSTMNSVTYDPRPQDGVVVGEWTAFDRRVLRHLRIQP